VSSEVTQTLITGMHRSGTTLVGDLFGVHPDVHHVFHESVLMNLTRDQLFSAKTLPDHRMLQTRGELSRARNVEACEWVVDCDLASHSFGAKMSYPGPLLLQEWQDRTTAYVRRWLECLGASARVVHVIRHPFDVFISARRRWQGDPGHIANYGPVTLEAICRDWVHAVEGVEALLEDDPRALTVRYETLLESPEKVLAEIYLQSGLDRPEEMAHEALAGDVVFFGKVDASRAFPHRRESLEAISRSTGFLLRDPFQRFGYDAA